NEIGPTLRIYSWKNNCISLGFSQKIDEEVDNNKCAALGLEVVKRPTGGGMVFHNRSEITYSLVMLKDDPLLPKGLVPSYKKLSESLVYALNSLGIPAEISQQKKNIPLKEASLCFNYPAEYEVVAFGKKIVGSAQKRGKRALLQQGSIFVMRTSDTAFSALNARHGDINAVSVEEILGRIPTFEEMAGALIKGFEKVLGTSFNEI
ncbi:MAG: lipoate--protein ligase family protein, partial [Candidatus Margulisiibacteriota bacterium]